MTTSSKTIAHPPVLFKQLHFASMESAITGDRVESEKKLLLLTLISDERSNQLLVLRTQQQGWREQSSTERLVSKERHYAILQEAAGLVFEDRRADMRVSKGTSSTDMEVAADIMADLQHKQDIESQMVLGLHSKVKMPQLSTIQ